MADLDCYTSVAEDNRVDVIIGGKLVRVQQFSTTGNISVRKIGCNSKTNVKIYLYTKEDVDLFAAIDLKSFDTFLLPMDFITGYRSCISRKIIEERYKANDLTLLTSWQ